MPSYYSAHGKRYLDDTLQDGRKETSKYAESLNVLNVRDANLQPSADHWCSICRNFLSKNEIPRGLSSRVIRWVEFDYNCIQRKQLQDETLSHMPLVMRRLVQARLHKDLLYRHEQHLIVYHFLS